MSSRTAAEPVQTALWAGNIKTTGQETVASGLLYKDLEPLRGLAKRTCEETMAGTFPRLMNTVDHRPRTATDARREQREANRPAHVGAQSRKKRRWI